MRTSSIELESGKRGVGPLEERRPTATSSAVASSRCFSLSAGGCSWVFVNGPPTGHQQRDFFSCTEGKTAPVLDVIVAAISAAVILTAEDDADFTKEEYQRSGLLWGAISGASAYTGFNRVKACQSAQLEAALRRATEDAASASPTLAADPAPWPAPLAPPLRRPNGATGTGR